MTDQKTIERIRKWARSKARDFEAKYQETGGSATLKSKERYEDIADICELALKARKEEDADKVRRVRNQLATVHRMEEQAYLEKKTRMTIREVADWMMEVQV